MQECYRVRASKLRNMWNNDKHSENETGGRRRIREEGRDGHDNEVKRQNLGLGMVFFLGAAAVGNVFALRRRLLNIERQSFRGYCSEFRGEYATSGPRGSQTNYEDRSAQEAQRRWRAHLDEQLRMERIRRMKEAFAREKRSQANSYNAYHFTVLGLDATRPQPYSVADIKVAFRTKAFEYHPDQNPGNVQIAEVKFRQLLESYRLLKSQFRVK